MNTTTDTTYSWTTDQGERWTVSRKGRVWVGGCWATDIPASVAQEIVRLGRLDSVSAGRDSKVAEG